MGRQKILDKNNILHILTINLFLCALLIFYSCKSKKRIKIEKSLKINSFNYSELENNFFIKFNINEHKDIPKDFISFSKCKAIEIDLKSSDYNVLKEVLIKIAKKKDVEYLCITSKKIKYLPNEISSVKSLIQLEIFFDKLKYLPTSIFKLKNLKRLHIINNNIEYIPNSISVMNKLEYLSLVNFKKNYIPKSILNLKNLKFLNLGNNIKYITKEIIKLKNLKTLVLIDTPISKDDSEHKKTIIKYLNKSLPKCSIVLQDIAPPPAPTERTTTEVSK